MVKSTEIWKPVDVGGFYEGWYEVSTMGRIKILSKCLNARFGKRQTTERIGTGYLASNGYRNIIFKKEGIYRHEAIHRLVALAFIPNPENKRCINHINAIRHDNRVENLEWATHSENSRHKVKLGRDKSPRGEQHSRAKLTDEMVREIRRLYKHGKHTHRSLAQLFNVSSTRINDIINYKNWKHVK